MFRSFAVVPAAGHSRRMGTHKLLMPWRGATVIEIVLEAWKQGGVSQTVVTVRSSDEALRRLCENAGADVVLPDVDPPEMKVSVGHALDFIQQRYRPAASDAWLLAPADLPKLSARTISALLASYDPREPWILVPAVGGQRAHPVLFPWSLASCARQLSADEGINALLKRYRVRELESDDPTLLLDLDTPEDYQDLKS